MRTIVSLLLSIIVAIPCVADCTLSRSVLAPLTSNVTPHERKRAGQSIENLLVACPHGPSDTASRAIFFELVDAAFREGAAGEAGGGSRDRSEATWEGATQLEFNLQQYMDRIVSPSDIAFKDVILRTANARAISRLGPDAKYDVLQMVRRADPFTNGAGHHSAYTQAILALGFWIDPLEPRFNSEEKRDMTNVLLSKLASPSEGSSAEQNQSTEAALEALGHADAPEVLPLLQQWAGSHQPSLRDAAQASVLAVNARLHAVNQ